MNSGPGPGMTYAIASPARRKRATREKAAFQRWNSSFRTGISGSFGEEGQLFGDVAVGAGDVALLAGLGDGPLPDRLALGGDLGDAVLRVDEEGVAVGQALAAAAERGGE